MKVEITWHPVSELPEKRIRILTCDNLGYVQTGFYGCKSNISECHISGWFSDDLDEKTLDYLVYWAYFPETPIKTKGPFDYL